MRSMMSMVMLAGVSMPAFAQTCPSAPGWAKPERHLAARSADMRFALKAGHSVELGLRPRGDVRLAGTAGRPAGPKSYAGLAALDVAKAGKLEIVLSNRSYVDLIRDGKALKSASHRETPGCAGMRKTVSFDVTPGRYVVQLTDAPERTVRFAALMK